MVLRKQIQDLLDGCTAEVKTCTDLPGLQRLLSSTIKELHSPMRVAIVGKIKAGKSSLMNALLGADVVPTGESELTFNVNRFRFSQTPYARVVFRDGRQEEKALEDLRWVTARNESIGDYLRSINHVEVGYPCPILEQFDIWDTPGLESVYETDSENALRALGISPEEVAAWSGTAAASADAILYLFSKSLGESDVSVLKRFRGDLQRMSPVNAIGVLTRIDDYFPKEQDVISSAERVIQRLKRDHPILSEIFYLVHPVSSLLGLGARQLTDQDWNILFRLKEAPEDQMDDEVWSRDGEQFRTRSYPGISGLPSASERAEITHRLGYYGCKIAVDAIRSGVKSLMPLQQKLFEQSGIRKLQDVILSHFGNRSVAIKSYRRMDELSQFVFQKEYKTANATSQKAVKKIAELCANFRASSAFMQELEMLRRYYDGKLKLDQEESARMLEVTGEYGHKAFQRLGFGTEATISEMKSVAEARMSYFQNQSGRAVLDPNRRVGTATIAEAYKGILLDLFHAENLLDRETR